MIYDDDDDDDDDENDDNDHVKYFFHIYQVLFAKIKSKNQIKKLYKKLFFLPTQSTFHFISSTFM